MVLKNSLGMHARRRNMRAETSFSFLGNEGDVSAPTGDWSDDETFVHGHGQIRRVLGTL